MKKNFFILYFTLLNSVIILASVNPVDSTAVHKNHTGFTKTVVPDSGQIITTAQQFIQSDSLRSSDVTPHSSFRSFPELNTISSNLIVSNYDYKGEFTEAYLKEIFKTDNRTDTLIHTAKKLFNEILEHDKFINKMTGNELIQLPVGIQKRIGGNDKVNSNTTLTIGVIKVKIFPEYTVLDLFAELEIGELNTVLYFGASGIKLSAKGGLYGKAKLNLLADVPVGQNGGQWLLTFKGGLDKETGLSDDQTYITIDCEGNVKEIAIAADVRIAKSVALPIKADGSYKYPNNLEPGDGSSPVDNKSYVGTGFRVVVSSLNDLLVELNLPRFELKALPKWGFQMKNTVLDLSDLRNALNKINFPAIYTKQQLLIPDNEELWRGFYSKEVEILLPPEFSRRNSEERISVGAKNLIIDNFGVSGNFNAKNILKINEGNANKWQFSIDDLMIDLQVNHFVKAKFNGEIVLPVTTLKDSTITNSKGKDSIIKHGALKYKGLISADRNYSLRVDVNKDIDFSIFKSKAKLFRDSYIKLDVKNDKFQPEANLTGLMSFNMSQETALDTLSNSVDSIEELDFKGLSFQNFKIQTAERPYLDIEYMGYKDSISLPEFYGFEMGFYEIKVKSDTSDDHAELGFNSYINLDETGIHGDVRLRIIGELVEGDYLKWNYKTTKVDSIEVDVKRKSFEFKGKLHFFKEHKLYGKGLAGMLDLTTESLGLEMGARGIFSNIDNYRFWYVDTYGHPTNIKNDNFKIYDIGGGVYHHMRKAGVDERSGSMSGINYAPDKSVDFGFKALAAFEVKKSTTFNGLVAIEMSFNTHGGINRMGFYGAASLMTGNSNSGTSASTNPFGDVKSMQKTISDKEQSLANFHDLSIDREGINYFAKNVFPDLITGKEIFAAQVGIDFDFTNKSYFGLFDVFLNAGKIRGEGKNNRLGYLEFYNAPDDWYIYVGTPSKRFGVKDIPIGPVDTRMNLYYMTGSFIPPPADPPTEVIDILNLSGNELLFGRNFENELAQGNGYAFGSEFSIGKDFDWGIVYASVEASAGFDLMMKNFGDAYCKDNENRVGMDGWYATGQMYTYLQGDLGVKINLFGNEKKIRILESGLAAITQAQLPNPWFIKGYTGVKVQILGIVAVKARLKIIIGEECELIGKTGLQNIEIISDVSPHNNAINTDVFDTVQVAFNVPVNEEVIVEEDSGRKTYKVGLSEFSVQNNGKNILGERIWNAQKDLLIFESIDILPPENEITISIKVSFEENINGVWKRVTDDSGAVLFEEKIVKFTTGKAPEKIPLRNIVYMYPVKDQKYFFPKESYKGYIQLKKGQDYLFGGNGFVDELYYVDEYLLSQKVNFSYDKIQNRLNFAIPDLQNKTKYTFNLITTKPDGGNHMNNTPNTTYSDINNDVSISTNKINETVSGKSKYERLSFEFNTSRYNTFLRKMNRMSIINYYTIIDGSSDVGAMGLEIEDYEPFGIADIEGTIFTGEKPLIRTQGKLSDNYYTNRIYPLIYKTYPLDEDIYVNRDENILGLPPVRSMKISNAYRLYATNTPNHHYLKKNFPFRWHLAWAYKQDFMDIQYKIVNRYLNSTPVDQAIYDQYEYIINGKFPYLERELYEVKVEYILPNNLSGNSTIIKYKNEF